MQLRALLSASLGSPGARTQCIPCLLASCLARHARASVFTRLIDSRLFGGSVPSHRLLLSLPAHRYDYDKLSVDDFIGRAVVSVSSLREHHSSQSGWHALGGIKDTWVAVGSVFLTLVVDHKFVAEGTRNSIITNMAFMTARSHLLLATEQRYFAAQLLKATPVPTLSPAGTVALTVPGSGGLCAAEQLRVFCGTWNVGNGRRRRSTKQRAERAAAEAHALVGPVLLLLSLFR